jgi:hypothetical protein
VIKMILEEKYRRIEELTWSGAQDLVERWRKSSAPNKTATHTQQLIVLVDRRKAIDSFKRSEIGSKCFLIDHSSFSVSILHNCLRNLWPSNCRSRGVHSFPRLFLSFPRAVGFFFADYFFN